MEEFPQFNKEDSTLAALCYVPFFLINLIVPIYILMKKEDKFVRYHAVQSLLIMVSVFILSTVISILAILIVFLLMGAAIAGSSEPSGFFLAFYGGWLLAMIPSLLFSLIYILFDLYLAYCALNGKYVNIPFISGFALRHA